MSKHSAGPWSVGYEALDVQAPSERGGTFKVCDIRGWGYLTGRGAGALGLDGDDAKAIQEANAALIAAAPDMLAALRQATAYADIVARTEGMPAGKQARRLTATATSLDGSGPFETAEFDVAAARAAIAKAEALTQREKARG